MLASSATGGARIRAPRHAPSAVASIFHAYKERTDTAKAVSVLSCDKRAKMSTWVGKTEKRSTSTQNKTYKRTCNRPIWHFYRTNGEFVFQP